ncbi:MAG: kinase-like domain-containing protein [Piptocephalis tieghemiana]|nr:MAG: kinase-like domain-containing protein [Piptocephalis tieghemiana]
MPSFPLTFPSTIGKYITMEVIGQGSFGIVYKAKRREDGLVVVAKTVNYSNMTNQDRQQVVDEVQILRDLQHPNIVKYLDRYIDIGRKILWIFMEYCPGGDLAEFISWHRDANKRIPENTVWKIAAQLSMALHECHGEDRACEAMGSKANVILHRDIKPANVLLDQHCNVKLGDFGLSRTLQAEDFARTYVGTPYYMAPEVIDRSTYDEKCDMWALGCLLYELCTLHTPFEADTREELEGLIRRGQYDPIPRDHYSGHLSSFISALVQVNVRLLPHLLIWQGGMNGVNTHSSLFSLSLYSYSLIADQRLAIASPTIPFGLFFWIRKQIRGQSASFIPSIHPLILISFFTP